MRGILHVDDTAAAAVHVMELPREVYEAHTEVMLSHIEVGTGLNCRDTGAIGNNSPCRRLQGATDF